MRKLMYGLIFFGGVYASSMALSTDNELGAVASLIVMVYAVIQVKFSS